MLFARLYKWRGGSEEDQKRSTQLYKARGEPPYKVIAHYEHCNGGIVIVEADSAEALLAGTIPWLPYWEYESIPIVDVTASVPLLEQAYKWRDSVK